MLLAITVSVVVVLWQAGKAPTGDHSFGNNQTTTVHVDAGGSKSIYTNPPSGGNIRCTAHGDHEQPAMRPYLASSIGQWGAVFSFTVKHGGDYTISCFGPSDARYAVGEYITVDEFNDLFRALFWGIGAGVVLVIAGVVTLIVTAVRRGRAKPPARPMQYPQQWPPRY